MDIDIVIAAGDHILKALAGLQVFPAEDVLAIHHPAFAHADFRGEEQLRFLKPGDVVLQEEEHFNHLFARFHFGKAQIIRIHGIFLDDAGGVEMENPIDQGVKDQHILARILDFALFLELLIQFLHFAAVLLKVGISMLPMRKHSVMGWQRVSAGRPRRMGQPAK